MRFEFTAKLSATGRLFFLATVVIVLDPPPLALLLVTLLEASTKSILLMSLALEKDLFHALFCNGYFTMHLLDSNRRHFAGYAIVNDVVNGNGLFL